MNNQPIKPIYDKLEEVYRYQDFEIYKTGGFITCKQWHCYNPKTKLYFWQVTKKEVIETLNKILTDIGFYETLSKLYKTPLY